MSRYLVKGNVNAIDRSSGIFLHSLASKLLTMSEKIDEKIKDLENKQCVPQTQEKGVQLVSIDTPRMVLGIRYEYLEYIKRYGPPVDGKFNQKLINDLRAELNIAEDF